MLVIYGLHTFNTKDENLRVSFFVLGTQSTKETRCVDFRKFDLQTYSTNFCEIFCVDYYTKISLQIHFSSCQSKYESRDSSVGRATRWTATVRL
jgi:hypothetical protein